jgi:hypothetical protein
VPTSKLAFAWSQRWAFRRRPGRGRGEGPRAHRRGCGRTDAMLARCAELRKGGRRRRARRCVNQSAEARTRGTRRFADYRA